jgi:hypothetical protein
VPHDPRQLGRGIHAEFGVDLPKRLTFFARQSLLRLFEHDGCECFGISPNVSPNVYGDREYIVNVQAQEASKRLWTFSRKAAVKIPREVKPLATAVNRESQEVLDGARICDVEISDKCPYLRTVREANLNTYQPVVEALNWKLPDRLEHCLANLIVVQKLPHRISLEVGHRQRFSWLDVLDHGAVNPLSRCQAQSGRWYQKRWHR